MEVRPGYKLTEVGVIPEEWACTAIASVARLESGHTPSKRRQNYWGGSVQWVSLHDTAALEGREIEVTAKTITEDGLNHSSARLLPPGTVVFSRTATVGKATVMATSMATSQDFANYICGPSLHNHFLVYLFRSMRPMWQRLMAGSIHNTIYMPTFRALKIVIPPLAEQHSIAAALADVDALLGGLERLIAKKRDLKQAAMQQLLTGQTRLPGFCGEWEIVQIGEIASVRTGPFGSTLHESDYVQDGTPIITVEHLGEFGVTRQNLPLVSVQDCKRLCSYALEVGDIVFSRVGSIDRNALIREEEEGWLFSGRLLRIRPDKKTVFAPYLSLQFHTATFKNSVLAVAVGQTMASLNTKILKGLSVPMPSIGEQTAIATVLSDMDTELAALEARRDKTRLLKQGMMQELLTGRTRLVCAR
ncbi:MAG: restriction endonuclease subunit S [Candidatus Accumulibacter sp. UW26]|jgi:type I restriction enzyme S subunit